jgi:hypothetical protein
MHARHRPLLRHIWNARLDICQHLPSTTSNGEFGAAWLAGWRRIGHGRKPAVRNRCRFREQQDMPDEMALLSDPFSGQHQFSKLRRCPDHHYSTSPVRQMSSMSPRCLAVFRREAFTFVNDFARAFSLCSRSRWPLGFTSPEPDQGLSDPLRNVNGVS